MFFLLFALAGIVVIVTTTEVLISMLHLPLLAARVLVGIVVGIFNFLLNTFFNFKLI